MPAGSITHIANTNSSLKEEYSYDAWGRLRNPATQVNYTPGNEPTLFLGRGYTGHEHLPWFGLINMNARLYDAALGRFLSPDPYVQAPDFTQNFNRYSYCLNNPLAYVDENGEFVLSYLSGFVKGLVKGKNPFVSGWKSMANEAKIYGGLYTSDKHKGFFGQLWEIASRVTWQLPQTLAGLGYSYTRNIAGKVDRVDYLGGATFLTNENSKKHNGITLGNYINMNIKESVNTDFTTYVTQNDPMYMHEYGHYIDSQKFGFSYLLIIGVLSVFSAGSASQVQGEPTGVTTHDFRWYERRANKNAAKYFEKYGINWDTDLYRGYTIETFYPKKDRR